MNHWRTATTASGRDLNAAIAEFSTPGVSTWAPSIMIATNRPLASQAARLIGPTGDGCGGEGRISLNSGPKLSIQA